MKSPSFFAAILSTAMLVLSAQTSRADSATWNLNPGSGDWNTATNWTPATIPNGPSDTATFDVSNSTGVSLSDSAEVNAIVFNAGASAFTITVYSPFQLTISGAGIANNSATVQEFVIFGYANIQFLNNSTANNATFVNNSGAVGVNGGLTQFFDTSTAGNGSFTNNAGEVSGAGGGFTLFRNSSTAASGTFTNNGAAVIEVNGGITTFQEISSAGSGAFINNGAAVAGVSSGYTQFDNASTASNGTFINNGGPVKGASGGYTFFYITSTAGDGTFINNGGAVAGAGSGSTFFFNAATAGNSTLTANGGAGEGGSVLFGEDSTGGTARVEVFDNGNVNISSHNAPGVTIGSIEGTGNVLLGANNLTVGTNGVSTSFSGKISNGGEASSLAKIGSGTLTFQGRGDNDYLEDTVGLILISKADSINLNFTGPPDAMGSLVVDGVTQTQGVYGSPDSGAPNPLPEFAGLGTVLVTRGPTPTATPTATPTPTPTSTPIPPPPAVGPILLGAQPQPQMVIAPATATFTAIAIGTQPIAYQWNRNGVPISGATSATYTTPPTTPADNGANFTVTVTNSVNGLTSAPATLTVASFPIAPTIVGQPQTIQVSQGNTASFYSFATGTSPLSYQWKKNGVPINGATSSTYTTPPTTIGDDGAQFTVDVTNSGGAVTSDPGTLFVTTTSAGLGGFRLPSPVPPTPTDLIGVRYKFRLVTNASQSLRIVFGFNYFTAPGSPIGGYEVESNVYSGTLTYADGGCTTWPPLGTYTEGVASLRNATADYPYGGGQQPAVGSAIHTSDPANWPVQTYLVDNIPHLWKSDSISQFSMNDLETQMTIERGDTLNDVSGFVRCGLTMLAETYRMWTITTEVNGHNPVINQVVVPDADARYLVPAQAMQFASEFLNGQGTFVVQYWDFAYKRESYPRWTPVSSFMTSAIYDGTGQDFGTHVISVDGVNRVEISNIHGISYLTGNLPFLIATPMQMSRPTPAPRPTPPPHITPVPPPPSPRPTLYPRPTPPPHLTPVPTPSSPRPTPAPRP